MMAIPHSFYFVFTRWGPFHQRGLTLIPAWITDHIHYKVWDEIAYPFPNFNGATVEVCKWISYFIPHFIGHVITYPGNPNSLIKPIGVDVLFHRHICLIFFSLG